MAEGCPDKLTAPPVPEDIKKTIERICTTECPVDLIGAYKRAQRPSNLSIEPALLAPELFDSLDEDARNVDMRMQYNQKMMSKAIYKLFCLSGKSQSAELKQDFEDCAILIGQTMNKTGKLRITMAEKNIERRIPESRPILETGGESRHGDRFLGELIEMGGLECRETTPEFPNHDFWNFLYETIDQVMQAECKIVLESYVGADIKPYWQIRHYPDPAVHLHLLLYHNGPRKFSAKEIEDQVKCTVAAVAHTDKYKEALDSLKVSTHNITHMQMTEYSSQLSGEDDCCASEVLPFLVYRGGFHNFEPHQPPSQYSARAQGTVGVVLRGESGGETGILAATSAHVVLDDNDRASLDREKDQRSAYNDIHRRNVEISDELRTRWYIETDKPSGQFTTVGPPIVSYRQHYDTSNKALPWSTSFLQDIALLKVNNVEKNIKVSDYFNDLKTHKHPGKTNDMPPFYTKILGVLKIERPGDIIELEVMAAKVLVAGIYGRVVKSPHHRHLDDTIFRASHRVCFVTDTQLVPAQSGTAVYVITKQKQELYILGLLRGQQTKALGDNSQTVYEAVLLWPSMHHVEYQAQDLTSGYSIHNLRYKSD